MKRIFGLALLVLSFTYPAIAAKNSQDITIADDLRVGDSVLPAGHYTFSWTKSSGSEMQLTLKSERQKSVTVPAHMVHEKHASTGLETAVVNGVTYLQQVHTRSETFTLNGAPNAPK